MLQELRSLARRDQPDVVLIDDIRLLGRQGKTGSDKDPHYPVSTYDWRSITQEAMEKIFEPGDPKSLVLLQRSDLYIPKSAPLAGAIAPAGVRSRSLALCAILALAGYFVAKARSA